MVKLGTLAFGTFTVATLGSLGGTLSIGIFWWIQKPAFGMRKKHIAPLIIVILLGYILPFTIQPYLIARIGHGFVGMIVSLVPLLTIIVSIPILGIYPRRKQLLGVLGGFICIAFIMADGLERNVSIPLLILALIMPLFYAVSNSFIQKSFKDISSITLSGFCMAISCMATSPMAIMSETITISDSLYPAIIAMVIFSILGRGIGTLLFFRLIMAKGPLFGSMVTYVIPIFVIFWSWVDNEVVTLMQLVAITGVLSMVALVQTDITQKVR